LTAKSERADITAKPRGGASENFRRLPVGGQRVRPGRPPGIGDGVLTKA